MGPPDEGGGGPVVAPSPRNAPWRGARKRTVRKTGSKGGKRGGSGICAGPEGGDFFHSKKKGKDRSSWGKKKLEGGCAFPHRKGREKGWVR